MKTYRTTDHRDPALRSNLGRYEGGLRRIREMATIDARRSCMGAAYIWRETPEGLDYVGLVVDRPRRPSRRFDLTLGDLYDALHRADTPPHVAELCHDAIGGDVEAVRLMGAYLAPAPVADEEWPETFP